ncbi:MAG: PIN domain-containing protein [Desulfomonile sp.]|jgi:predicted nucleic acid-binding protein
MKKIFIDTSAWDAIEDSGDVNHEAAMIFKDEIANRYELITSNYILDETYTLLLRNIGYARTVAFHRQLEMLKKAGVLQVIQLSENIIENAWIIFEKYNQDKCWSFTDCASYAAMKDQDIDEVFSFDRHFEQMGLIRKP